MSSDFASRLLTFLFFCFSIFSYPGSAKCHDDDETGLLTFKSGITQDLTGMLSSWTPGTDCCTWNGVRCQEGGRVSTLSVGKMFDPTGFLSGTISPSLSKLKYLNGIYFHFLSNLTGRFPTFLYDLPELTDVYIENNKLSGPLPVDIGKRLPKKLRSLSFKDNQFTGSIPSSFSLLTQLVQLNLGDNKFTGSIPDGIRRMKSLELLNLEKNQLSGKIPDFFSSFPDLRYLRLSYNKFSGEIPASMSALAPTLNVLEMGNNFLTGKIPDYIGTFQQLDALDLSANQLTGRVPTGLSNMTRIFDLNLARNQLMGPFPELDRFFGELDLSYNKFRLGKIPNWVVISPSVSSLKLAGCGLKFRLDDFKPTQMYYSLRSMDLSDNQISGSPFNLWNQIFMLVDFKASGNRLRFNMSNLVIPPSLRKLDLSRNQVFGKIPRTISGLEKVDLSYNHLCGQIPTNNFSSQAFQGNDCLCGSPLPTCKK